MSETSYDGNRPVGAFSSLQTWSTYSWINNEYFYSLIPQAYKDYYHRFVKHWFYWYDGYVPYFHNNQSGMVSTNLAYTILKKLSEKTVGSKLLFDDEGYEDTHSITIHGKEYGSVEFMEYWSRHNDLTSTIKQAFEFAYAGGDSIIKHDTDGKELFVSTVRKDNYLIDTDFRGRITKAQFFIYSYTKLIDDQTGDKKMYYLMEEREFIDDKPMYRVCIKENNSSVTNGKTYNTVNDVPFERLPNDVKRKFKRDYPKLVLNEWSEMPFKDLGVYLIKATKKVHFLPDAPFGESLLAPLIHILMTYDFYFSSLTTNLYTTRDKVLLPHTMDTPRLGNADQFYANEQNWYSGLDSYIYQKVPYTNPEDSKPIFIQPELRDWKQIRDVLLQTGAMILGVDERTIASSIVPNSEKPTAREISVDEDTTSSFISDKREINRYQLNEMVENVLYFYGFVDEIVVLSFSRAGMSNTNNTTTIATLLKQNRLGDQKSLLQMVWPDKNEQQINKMMELIEEEDKKKQEFMLEQQEQKSNDVEENIERQNDNTEYHIKKGEE